MSLPPPLPPQPKLYTVRYHGDSGKVDHPNVIGWKYAEGAFLCHEQSGRTWIVDITAFRAIEIIPQEEEA